VCGVDKEEADAEHWLVSALLVVLAAGWACSASAINRPQTFSLLDSVSRGNDRPLGDFTFDRPPVPGDRFSVTNALYRWDGAKRGARVGRVEVLHTFVAGFGADFSHDATVLFVAQIYLPRGTMLAQGYGQVKASAPSRLTFPIVGYVRERSGLRQRPQPLQRQGEPRVHLLR
jgi:hypothetical protein